jgi:hypothetical protein
MTVHSVGLATVVAGLLVGAVTMAYPIVMLRLKSASYFKATVSIDVAVADSADRDIDDTIERADRGLYMAKNTGRTAYSSCQRLAKRRAATAPDVHTSQNRALAVLFCERVRAVIKPLRGCD